MADPRAERGAGPRAQADRVRGRHLGDVRHPGGLLPVFLAPRSLGEARERVADPLDRHIEPYRRVCRRALLLGARRPVGRDDHADADDGRGAAARPRVSSPVQRRLARGERLARLSRQQPAGHPLRARSVRLRRYVALRLRRPARLVQQLRARLPSRPRSRQREPADQPGLPRRLRPGRLLAPRHAVLSGSRRHHRRHQAALRAAALPGTAISACPTPWAGGSRSMPARST